MANKLAISGLLKELNAYGVQEMQYLTSGNVFFVDSGATNASDTTDDVHGLSWEYPHAKIDYAVGRCTADNGDVIYVAPGHAETVDSAGDLSLDVAGITVIGLGRGDKRPAITIGKDSVAGADVNVDAAEITLKNMIFKISGVNVTAMIDVNADGFTLEDCDIQMHVASYEAVTGVDINGGSANAADRCTIRNCTFVATTTDGTDRAIELGEVADRVVIEGCVFWGDYADACVHNPTGKVLTNLLIRDCVMENDNGNNTYCIELVSACTGILLRNAYKTGAIAPGAVDPGSCASIECYHDDDTDVSGILDPAAT